MHSRSNRASPDRLAPPLLGIKKYSQAFQPAPVLLRTQKNRPVHIALRNLCRSRFYDLIFTEGDAYSLTMGTTLLVLAAGMGSRYGGLKQLESLGPDGKTLLDYSIDDAIRAGFNSIVFVIRDNFAEDFEKNWDTLSIEHRNQIRFSGFDDLPKGITVQLNALNPGEPLKHYAPPANRFSSPLP